MTSSLAQPANESTLQAGRLGIARGVGEEAFAEFNGAPQTIGAGPRCTVRLDGPGLRPLHCVITPTDEGPVARRWAPGTMLNGSEFTEARLAAGDALRVGEVDLWIVSLDEPEPLSSPSELDADADAPALTPPPVAEAPSPVALPSPPSETSADGVDPAPSEEPIADWVDDSVEEVARSVTLSQQVDPAPLQEPTPTIDPAVPNHLLQPWAPAGPQPSPRDTATSAVPLNPIPQPGAEEPVSDPEPIAEPDEWSIEPAEISADPIASEVSSESVSAWEAEFAAAAPIDVSPVAEVANVFGPLPEESAPTDAPEPSRGDAELASDSAVTPVASEPDGEDAGLVSRERFDTSRRRARLLLQTLREERTARGQVESKLAETQAQLEAALSAADAAATELTRLAATEAQLAAVERDLAEALNRLEALEQMPVAPAEPPTADVEVDSTPAAEPDPTAEQQPIAEPTPIWGAEEIAAPGPETQSEPAPMVEQAVAAAEVESTDAPVDEPAMEGGLWGIEQLAGAPAEVSPWGEAPEAAPAPADEPTLSAEYAAESAEPLVEATAPSEPEPITPQPVEEQPSVPSHVEEEVVPAPLAAFQPKPADDSGQAPAADGAPASFIEQYAHMLPDDDEPQAPAPPIEPVAEPVAEDVPSDENDESIDDYMKKMMERLRGDAEPVVPVAPEPVASPARVEARPEAPPAAPELPPEPVEPIKDLSELKREPTREVATDMNALRQLANQSARHAIDVAATKQSREQATLRLTASAVMMGCGALAVVTASSPFALQFLGGVLGAAGGGWFGYKTLRACQVANREAEMAEAAKAQTA